MLSDHIYVFDNVLENPQEYRSLALRSEFKSIGSSEETFHGIAIGTSFSAALPSWIVAKFPHLTPTINVFRKSPLNQDEPQYIHEDVSMGDWTGLLYLSLNPPVGDGTLFWTHTETGSILSDRTGGFDGRSEWKDLSKWTLRSKVEARFNRLLLFPAPYFHSRSLVENYGEGDDARLIQLVFGTGDLTSR